MWKHLAILWQKAKEQEQMYGKYSHVIILRDDAYWFRDFNLTQMLELRGIERLPGRPGEGQLYSVLCDKHHISGGDRHGLMDYFFLVDRVEWLSFVRLMNGSFTLLALEMAEVVVSHMFCFDQFFWEQYFGKHPFPVTVATKIFRLGISMNLHVSLL